MFKPSVTLHRSRRILPKITERFLLLHIPFPFLVLFVMLSLSFHHSFELTLREKRAVQLQPLFIEQGLPLLRPMTLELNSFVMDEGKAEGKKARQTYTSYLLLDGEPRVLSVNKPVKIDRYILHQMDWQLHIRAVDFLIDNTRISLQELIQTGYNLSHASTFRIVPVERLDTTLKYRWVIVDKHGNAQSTALFLGESIKQKEMLIPFAADKISVQIINEDFGFSSIVVFSWAPFRFPLLISALLFLCGQILVYTPMAMRFLKREPL